MRRSTFRLSKTLQAAVYTTFGLLLLTGAGWMIADRHRDEAAWQEWPAFLLKIHGAAAMVALLVLGALVLHIKRGWAAKVNRWSGASVIALNVFLVVTGYGLYYAGDENLRARLSRWHAWIGLGTLLILPLHIFWGRAVIRRLIRQREERTHAP